MTGSTPIASLPDSVRLQIERLILDNVKDTSSVEELLNRIHTTSQKAIENISTPDYDLDKAIVSVLISSTTLPHAVHNTIAKVNSIYAKELKMVGCSGNRAAENALAEVRRNAIMAKTQGESSPSQSGEFIKTPFKYAHWINRNPKNATEWIESLLKTNDKAKLRDLFQALYEINFFQEHWGLYQNLVKESFGKDATTDILLEFVPCEKMHELSDIATFVNKLTTQELKYPGRILAALALEKSVDYERLLNQACKCDCAAAVAVIIGVASTEMQSKDSFVRVDALQLFKALFEKKQGFDEAAKAAATGMQSETSSVRWDALQLFKALVEKGHGFDEAAKVATTGMQSKTSYVQEGALQLFKALVEKRHGFDEAAKAATTGMQSETPYVQKGALKLFHALVEKKQGFDEAAKAATTGMQSEDYSVRADAIKLFKALVEKGKCFAKAAKAATTGMQSEDYSVREGALKLFKALVEKGKCFAKAAKAATTGITSEDRLVRAGALQLFQALFEKGQGFSEAAKAATTGLQSETPPVRTYALKLFQTLFEKGQGFDEAAKAATTGMQSEDYSVRADALKLFQALFEKKQGFDEALAAATNGMQSKDSYVQKDALQLFQALVEKGHGFAEAEKAATTGLQSEDYSVREDALKLFKALFEKGHGFAEAAKAATTGMQSEDYSVREYALRLFQALFAQGHGFDEALAAAANGMQSKNSYVQLNALELFQALFAQERGFDEAARCIILNSEYSKQLFLMLLESLSYLEVAFKIAECLEGDDKQASFRKIAEAIDKVRRPVFRYDLTQLCLQAVNKFGSFKSHKQLVVVEPLLRLLEPEDCSKILGLVSDKKIFSDNRKMETLLELLILLNTSKRLTPDEKRLIISKLEGSKTPRDLHHNSRAAIGLIYMEAYKSFTQGEERYPEKLKRQAMKYFAISDVKGITEEQLSERLFFSRDPHALITYTSRIHSLGDPQADEALSKYITALIHGKEVFRAMRNDRTHNQHLAKIDASTLQQWQQGCESDVEGIQEPTKEIDKKEWLRTKLITDNHLTNLGDFPYIKDYIEGDVNAQKELNKKLRELKRESPPELILQSKLMRLVSASQTELPRRIEEISKLLDKVDSTSELKNDLKELLTEKSAKKRSGLRVLDSDDPYDLLLCGTEVLGSCLRVDGAADLNKGLLGHLLDGKIRLLCVKDDLGKIVARTLIRILLDDNGSPVIHQDRFYGDASYNKVLQEAAKKKASEMGLPLVTQSDSGKRFEGNVHSYKGPSPYEHVDPMGGVQRGYYESVN